MKTYNIELPAEFRSGNSIPVERATITRERMTEILQDAIEADRKRIAEPVKYWLCCGSTDLTHADRKQPDCYDPDKAKLGTAESHKDSPSEPSPAQKRRERLRSDPVKAAALDRARERIAAELTNRDEPDLAKCAECGAEMIHVRPGKWQHPDCTQSPRAS